MDRQSFLKSAASVATALMVPTVRLRPAVGREELLRPFCLTAEWSGRNYEQTFMAPFMRGGYTFGCDGNAIARTRLKQPEASGQEIMLPRNFDEVWDKHRHAAGEWRGFSLPPPAHAPLIHTPLTEQYGGTCPYCLVRRVSLGDLYPESEQEERGLPSYDPDDNTVGDASCPDCRGRTYYEPSCLLVEGVVMDYAKLPRIAALPGVQVARGRLRDSIVFRADGFDGVAMGMVTDARAMKAAEVKKRTGR